MAENGNDPIAETTYTPEIHGKITSFEDVIFEPAEAPTKVVFGVGTEKDLENAKEIEVSFENFAKWAEEEGLDLEKDEDANTAAKKYFEEYYSEHLSDEGKKSLKAQMFEGEDTSENDLMSEVMNEAEVDYEKLYGALSMVKAVVQKYAREMDDATAYEFRKQLGEYYFIK